VKATHCFTGTKYKHRGFLNDDDDDDDDKERGM
jgi:hypothetical protein